jgi:hypothetical protein
MPGRFKKIHPALKHAAYSATALLPGEDAAAFEKLLREVIAEFTPVGALEKHIVTKIAHLMWREQNLPTFRIAELARKRYEKIKGEKVPKTISIPLLASFGETEATREAEREGYRIADQQARQELGDIYELIDIGESATIEGLVAELDVKERLDSLINKCLKQLLTVRGIKSLSSSSASAATPQIAGPRKAG